MEIVEEAAIHVLEAGGVTSAKGFSAGGMHCGIRKRKDDLGWLVSEVPTSAAAVYTTNQFQAAPLQVTRESLQSEKPLQAVCVNSGVANACTGEQGLKDAYEMRRAMAEKVNLAEEQVAVASTGLIGDPLPIEKIKAGFQSIGEENDQTVERFEQAILTTDTCTKHVAVQVEIDGKTVTVGGAAKGSGMIDPNMATMLAFITTDASVEESALQNVLKQGTNRTFNMITVDGDSSTNDMVLVMANGKAETETLTEDHPSWSAFVKAFEKVSEQLAKEIARDGEGATKLVEVHVKGATTDQAARSIGKEIISSNLVKTAIYGSDPNWGRIVCAIGYGDEPIDPEKVTVSLGDVTVVDQGLPIPFDEEKAKQPLQQETVPIYVDLHLGDGTATAWGCDLTYEYVRINAAYRT
ncbi:bifunctional ornithine acetyltransferase/N-acetylglutamate synthase [Texcoconibacillus texcoconensis]|uniref:Arginine biosynthesis bifunctional protein ArgJ n=1 Tax=Texcoconibacillus texcoconensis TaxID=1095777 RepID=A0A840QS33_9BACI|nr:bifunctional ornithine acetyltransferase/N-acetylglutamate synthase [Texcoconibacillus texcoconensis]MBB5174175.1 glutamate N-acetyltransferase/amino-acid N-acetyltransferase [Texcoconibacillus texcoconensis]